MLRSFYKFFRNRLSKTKFYWKYRHLLQKNIWKSYKDDSYILRRGFYSEFMKLNNLKSVFEFGCASGPNFFNLYKSNKQIYYFGYDISKKAINSINFTKKTNRIKFNHCLSLEYINSFLKYNKLDKFDLAIFDRVLYMLTEKQIIEILDKYSTFFDYVIIDDFHSELPKWDDEKYIYYKNYIKIFKNNGFKIIDLKDSQHLSSNNKIFEKILIFKSD